VSNRSAIHTIKGYFYQFDYTIIQILNQQDETSILTVEEIEDLDVETENEKTAIQCKYYESTDYNHSVIAKPIRFMVKDFIERKRNNVEGVRYKIYGYYKGGQDKLALPVSLDFLKSNFLTFSKDRVEYIYHEEINASDEELEEFIMCLDIDINASEYSYQLVLIYDKLKEIFGCDDFEAENYYYNNALNEIKKLSVESSADSRRVSKLELLRKINNKQVIFNKWFLKLKGKRQHFKELRSQYFASLNTENFDRFFLIEVDRNYKRAELIESILMISRKYSKVTRRNAEKFCPFIFIHILCNTELLEIKKQLRNSKKRCIDGYDFQGAEFSTNSMLEPINSENPIYIKFLNSVEDLNDMLVASNNTKQIYQFYIKEPFFHNECASINHIKIQLESFNDIKEIV